VAVQHEVVNQSNQTLEPQLYVQLVRDGNKPQGESSFYSTFTGPAVFTEAKKYQKVEFADAKKGKAEFEKSTTSGYVAMVQHYFASAWLLPDGLKRDIAQIAATVPRNSRRWVPWPQANAKTSKPPSSWDRKRKKSSRRFSRAWSW
jgi:YidC/Oxa1 family membrane protein insertase